MGMNRRQILHLEIDILKTRDYEYTRSSNGYSSVFVCVFDDEDVRLISLKPQVWVYESVTTGILTYGKEA